MPPVFGIWNTDSRQIRPETIRRMNEAAHYIIPRKLSFIDITTAHVASALSARNENSGNRAVLQADPFIIAADAGLYNRRGLGIRLDLVEKVDQLSDAALILEAYKKWGQACVNYLYGDFAFVIFNTQTGEFFCARDPLGVRPFFYAMHRGEFIFASELRMVLAAFETKPAIRLEYLLDTLVTVKSEKSSSPYVNIHKLPPAFTLQGKKDQMILSEYWIPDANAEIELSSEAEYTEMFRELLVNAVNMRCAGAGSLGCELSGGLDSSAITGIAASSMGDNIHAFSNIFPGNTGLDFKDEHEFIGEMFAFKPV
jgi:asparagine synthase (glutamine-hydrolysing)